MSRTSARPRIARATRVVGRDGRARQSLPIGSALERSRWEAANGAADRPPPDIQLDCGDTLRERRRATALRASARDGVIGELVVGRGLPPSLKLRRTTVALAKVVRPCQGGPYTRAIYCRGSGPKRSVGQPSVVAGRRVVRPALRANVDECSLSLRPEGHASLSGRAGRRRLGNLLGVRMTHAFYIGRSPISSSIYGILLMPSAYYPKRTGEYVYDVTVSKDETRRLSRRYCARLSNAERIENGRLVSVQIDVKDAYRANSQRSHAGARCVLRYLASRAVPQTSAMVVIVRATFAAW